MFSGSLKHGSKSNDAGKNLEHVGQEGEVARKNEHANKHQLDGKHVAKVLNSE